jgi:subtilisin family serine protease
MRGRGATSAVAPRALTGHIFVVWRAYEKDAKMAFALPASADRADAGWDPEAALRLVRLPALMQSSAGAPSVAVGLIDGPIALNHPDLASENVRVLEQSGGGACTKPESTACTHGTYVAGILHATRGGYVRGICPGCTLLVRSIFSEAAEVSANNGLPNATVEELAAALRDVIEAGARVVNLSAGLVEAASRAEPALDQALELAARRGVIIVAAAGNQGTLGSSAITRHPWVIPVVGCGRHGQVLAQSNLGASIGRHGLAAPGHEITSLAASGGHATFSGSSAAVPFVTGAIALLWSVFPRVSAAQLRLTITGSVARRRSVTPPLMDASAAYAALEPIMKGVRAS